MSVTESERKALSEFCKVHRTTEDVKRDMKLHARSLADVKKDGIQELTELLQESKSSIYRLERPSNATEDDFPTFVRLKKSTSSKTLTPELLEQAVNSITQDVLRELAEREQGKGKRGKKRKAPGSDETNGLEAIVSEAVVQAIRRTRSTEKQVADITSSLPRGTDDSVITDAPQEIQEYVYKLVDLQTKLKRITKQYKDELTVLKKQEEDVRQEVDQFLKRGNKDSFKLNVNVDGDRVHYFIRRRKVVTKKPMSATEIKEHVHNTVSSLLRNATRVQSVQDVNSDFIEALRSSVYQTLLYHLQNRERQEEEKILLHRGRGRAQNLQVYESQSASESQDQEQEEEED